MKLHSKAWDDINILVFGDIPGLPMRIEQLIVGRVPSLDTQIESFEKYDDAYNFCKENKNTGLIFMIDNGELLIYDIIKQLSTHFESIMPICPCVLLTDDHPSFSAMRAMKECENIIDIQKYKDFENTATLDVVLVEIWNKYVNVMSNKIWGGESLQDLVINEAMIALGLDNYGFCRKVLTMLSSGVNLSWFEKIKSDWSLFLKKCPNINSFTIANPAIKALINENFSLSLNSIDSFMKSDKKLSVKIEFAIEFLLEAKRNNNLVSTLQEIGISTKLSSPTLLRIIKQNQAFILNLARETTIRKAA